MTQTRDTPENPSARDEAIAWHVRLEGGEDATGDDWRRFTHWLNANPSHHTAYQDIEALWAELEVAKDQIRPHLSLADAAARATPEQPEVLHGPAVRRWGYRLAALAASILLFVGIWAVWRPTPQAGHYATGFGERQEVVLADGSHIYLNANTRITTTLNPAARRVVLEHGEALFDVAKDPDRPFWVAAGSQRVRVVGTMFDILKGADTVTVTVARGIVDVMPKTPRAKPDAPAKHGQVARLIAGQQLVHQNGALISQISTIDPERFIAWRDGHLIYDDAPLSQVAEDLNRYFQVQIEPQNARVGALHFSGVLQLDTQDNVVQRLEDLLPIRTKRVDGIIFMRLNAPQD